MSILFYEYAGCSTCKSAKKWLIAHGVEFTAIPIVDEPPTASELKKYHRDSGLDIKKFFNVSGQSYRAMKLGDRMASLSVDDCVKLLAADGKLIKRPLLVKGADVRVGFRESEYATLFS